LLAAFHLYAVDSHFEKQLPRVRYARYMDDFIILAPGRWLLKQAVRNLKRLMVHYRRWWVRALVPPGRSIATGQLLSDRITDGRSAYSFVVSVFVLLSLPRVNAGENKNHD
jgi:hypothetical protein